MSKLIRYLSCIVFSLSALPTNAATIVAARPALALPMAQPPHLALKKLQHPPPPRQWRHRPPSEELAKFRLADPRVVIGIQAKPARPRMLTDECRDMGRLAGINAAELADYIVGLPDAACLNGLFSISTTQAGQIYSSANFNMVAQRFAAESMSYDASNLALVNLTLYLRAGYYLAATNVMAEPDTSLKPILRPAITRLLNGNTLFAANASASSTGAEVIRLITNMHDEAQYLEQMKAQIERYTNTSSQPNAAEALRESTASQAFTSVLTVFYYAHFRPDALPGMQEDARYATALYNFVNANKNSLINTETAFQLADASRESLRFLQYPALRPTVKPYAQALLASSSMSGVDNGLWLAAAEAVKYYDNANCAEYGTCGYETRLRDAILTQKHSCSAAIKIRAQEMTSAQMQSACALLQKEEHYFHQMLQTKMRPVADDNNTSLEVVVFDDYNNYSKYASLIYGISTDNGGMYEEGNPAASGNQARFIAHEASWLRPAFSVWNLEHEYVHYLDGRFDMYGDFAVGTRQPTVWWIEGLAEYISLRNNNQQAIDVARGGNYRLSQIFGNTYAMSDYVPRAYRWGYMAVRFMFEKHRTEVDAIVGRMRSGDYNDYMRIMGQIGSRYDNEFASWVASTSTGGQPPLPGTSLPACNEPYPSYLGKNCTIYGLSSDTSTNASIMLPANARNLQIWTLGGSGDVDLYLAQDHHPSPERYDYASANPGNEESVGLSAPQAGKWYYVTLKARQPFSGVSLSATYD